MSITLFANTKFQGTASPIDSNCTNLRRLAVGARPSSIKLTDATDAILLFREPNWGGGAMYLRGAQQLDDLDRGRQLGQAAFRNATESVRITPFRIPLNFHVVANNAGELAGGFSELWELEARLRSALFNLNEWHDRERTLLRFENAQLTVRKNERHYDLKGLESLRFPHGWQSPVMVDVILTNRHNWAAGQGTPPGVGNTIVIALRDNDLGNVRSVMDLAGILAHELGHYWGSSHRSGGGSNENIMSKTSPHDIFQNRADPAQIEEWHTTLARYPMRCQDRRD